jgi:hypothetical protein
MVSTKSYTLFLRSRCGSACDDGAGLGSRWSLSQFAAKSKGYGSVLESRGNAVAWLREPSDALGGRSPLAAVASDPGAEKVSNMLYQMEHGIYS